MIKWSLQTSSWLPLAAKLCNYWGCSFYEFDFLCMPFMSSPFQAFCESFIVQLISRKIYASFLKVIFCRWLYTENHCNLMTVAVRILSPHWNLLHHHSILGAAFYVRCRPNVASGAAIADPLHNYGVASYAVSVIVTEMLWSVVLNVSTCSLVGPN